MPHGPGTYGSKRGRPPKKKKAHEASNPWAGYPGSRIKNIIDLVKNKLEEGFSKRKAQKAIADAKRKEENEKNRQELERDSEFGYVPKKRR